MKNYDEFKLAVEAASGGKNTVIFDDLGYPSIVVPIPKFKLSDVIDGAPQTTHPAFIVDGQEKDVIYISKYQNIVEFDRAYSLPMKDPRTYVNFDQAVQYCKNKGKGWHLMTNAEWAALALWCKKNNTMPRGNNNYGQDASAPLEKGVPTYKDGSGKTLRVATGSGAVSWAHDGTNAGIFDLNGNVWEWTGGLRLKNGEIQIIADNNASKDISQSDTSTLWNAIMPDGTLVAPGTAGTLKFDYTTATLTGGTGSFQLSDTIVNAQADETPYGYKTFETLTTKAGLTVPMILKSLGIYPIDASCGGDGLYMRNIGERLPFRGGAYGSTTGAGVFALFLSNTRGSSSDNVGFRSAFVNL
ncbi:hypothetical protein Q428_08630 [Fervidicella metallireducens AeB]|uniref:Sulfatase-modifying factor enzyme-like domain-containing protein n=1 Tax=Fervidicella metallireducens AeB TaxID=1403537 RepID=A0A017RWE4_9CLOT|nr:SUMF1/EgtB/PvdO family nonheme iron enzyme [Fervidicella metallireducens]EYE88255.1 hypothetical protein Q428_08630 [Fervidicella metallireducens AeB]